MFRSLLKQDIKALQTFMAVVECQGITAAQARLNLSQPVISTHLAHLESELDLVLCQRGRSGFSLTKEGKQVYEACLQLLQATQAFQHVIEHIKHHEGILTGELRIAMLDNLPDNFKQAMHNALQKNYAEHPKVHISVAIQSPQEIETALLAGQVDMGIGYFAKPLGALHYSDLFTEVQQVYCHVNHPLLHANKKNNHNTVIHVSKTMLEESFAWVQRGYLTEISLSNITAKNITAKAYHMEATRLFILAGTHIGYLPKDYAKPFVNRGDLVALLPEITEYTVTHQVVLKDKNHTLATQFLHYLESYLA